MNRSELVRSLTHDAGNGELAARLHIDVRWARYWRFGFCNKQTWTCTYTLDGLFIRNIRPVAYVQMRRKQMIKSTRTWQNPAVNIFHSNTKAVGYGRYVRWLSNVECWVRWVGWGGVVWGGVVCGMDVAVVGWLDTWKLYTLATDKYTHTHKNRVLDEDEDTNPITTLYVCT